MTKDRRGKKQRPRRSSKKDLNRAVAQSFDAATLKKRVEDFWASGEQRERLESTGVKFKQDKFQSVSQTLKSRMGPGAQTLLRFAPSKYDLRRSMVMEGGVIVSAADDGKPLPPQSRLVLLTQSISVFENSKNSVRTEVLVLERRR